MHAASTAQPSCYKKMLALGVSQYDPDPLARIAKANAKVRLAIKEPQARMLR